MKTVFNANIQENGLGGWLILVTNTTTNEEIFCNSFEEFESLLEFVGMNFQDNLELQWSKDDNVTPEHFFEVKQQIARLSKELQNNG